jgi:hypothetical protein
MMSGVAAQTAQMRIPVRFAELRRIVTAPAALQDDFRFCPSIAFDVIGIAARAHMIGAGPMAAFTAQYRHVLALEGLNMTGLHEAVVLVFVASLANFDADVF